MEAWLVQAAAVVAVNQLVEAWLVQVAVSQLVRAWFVQVAVVVAVNQLVRAWGLGSRSSLRMTLLQSVDLDPVAVSPGTSARAMRLQLADLTSPLDTRQSLAVSTHVMPLLERQVSVFSGHVTVTVAC